VIHRKSLEQPEGGSGFVSCPIPAEPPLTIRAEEFRVAADEAAFPVKHFGDAASTELNLTSPALFHKLAARHAVDDRDEFATLQVGHLLPLRIFKGLERLEDFTSETMFL
jgi:hypothetical protein